MTFASDNVDRSEGYKLRYVVKFVSCACWLRTVIRSKFGSWHEHDARYKQRTASSASILTRRDAGTVTERRRNVVVDSKNRSQEVPDNEAHAGTTTTPRQFCLEEGSRPKLGSSWAMAIMLDRHSAQTWLRMASFIA